MLLFLVSLFTWYGKQQFNNPFAPSHQLVIAGNSSGLLLYFEQSMRKKMVHQLVITPESWLPVDRQVIPLSDSWECVSTRPCPKQVFPEHSPSHWYTLDTTHQSTSFLRTDWPTVHLLTDTTLGATSIKKVFPFKDEREALYLQFAGNTILLLYNHGFTCTSGDTTSFKEKLDVLVISKFVSGEHIEQCREIFRPRFTIISSPNEATVPSFSNLYRFSSESIRYLTFRVQNDRLILIADTPTVTH